jgi:hypothetical protein
MQPRHHANVTRERTGTAEARRVAGLRDDAGGGQRSHAHYGGKELSNFVCIEAALNVALEIPHSAAEYGYVLTRIADLQPIRLTVMLADRDLGGSDECAREIVSDATPTVVAQLGELPDWNSAQGFRRWVP